MRAPDGSLSAVTVKLAEGGAHFQATLQWLQTGVHQVRGCLEPLNCWSVLLPKRRAVTFQVSRCVLSRMAGWPHILKMPAGNEDCL